jgi:hypothetical protein
VKRDDNDYERGMRGDRHKRGKGKRTGFTVGRHKRRRGM